MAALIVLGGYTWLWCRIGRAIEAASRESLDPKWAAEAEGFVRAVLSPPVDAAGFQDMVVLPEKLREHGQKILYAAPATADRRRQRLLRRF